MVKGLYETLQSEVSRGVIKKFVNKVLLARLSGTICGP
jgi:hypothetical protein